MAEERPVIRIGKTEHVGETVSSEEKDLHNEFNELEEEIRLTRVLERGMTADRLNVDLPPEVYGEWVHNDEVDVATMRAKNFEVDDKYAAKRALHSDGSGLPIIGDVIFMTCTRKNKVMLDKIQRKLYVQRHGEPKKVEHGERMDETQENRQYASEVGRLGLPIIDTSSTRVIGADEIEAAKPNNP